MGMDQSLLSQLHPILYRLLLKYLVLIDVQSQNLQEVRWAHGCWVGMGQIWAPMQLQNCRFWIINFQFWGLVIWPTPIPLLGLTVWASQEPKIPLPKDLYFWEPTATVQIFGVEIFYLEEFGLKFACQNLIHQHNSNFLWSFQGPKQPNHKLNDRFCDHSKGSVFFPIIDPDFWAILGFYLRIFFLKFRRFYLL